jgi:hypothetical protein
MLANWLRYSTLALVVTVAGVIYGIYCGAIDVPARFNPWAPLDVAATPDVLTGYKLSRARSDPARCLNALAQTGMQYDTLPDRVTAPGCGFENVVRLRSAEVRFGAPLTLSCPMALSFFMWERHSLQTAAQLHYGQRIVAIDHLGSYACRNINRGAPSSSEGPADASRSRHATANALDIAGFTLANGQRLTVLGQWRGNDADGPTALMLRDAHRGACRYFDGTLGPDYNAVHRDHFHLETGGYSMCH